MLCIQRRVELPTGATAAIWVPSTFTMDGPLKGLLTLSGKCTPESPLYVDTVQIEIELRDVNLFSDFIDRIVYEMFTYDGSPLSGAVAADKSDSYRKKQVTTAKGVVAGAWKQKTLAMNFTTDEAYSLFDGYRDRAAMDAGVEPITGKQPYRLTVASMSSLRGFESALRQILKEAAGRRGFKLHAGRVLDIYLLRYICYFIMNGSRSGCPH